MNERKFVVLMDQDKKPMGIAVNWQAEIGSIAGPFSPNDTKQSWLNRAAKRCGVSLRYITSLYYGHTKDPKYSIAQSILSAADRARLEKAKEDIKNVAQAYSAHAASLERIDPDFYCDQINALVNAARILGGRDRA
jgi:hypothetical protein